MSAFEVPPNNRQDPIRGLSSSKNLGSRYCRPVLLTNSMDAVRVGHLGDATAS